MTQYAILTNHRDELFAGKLLGVGDDGVATIAAIDAVDLLLAGDGPCQNRISRPAAMLLTFDDRGDMLDRAKAIYQMNT